MGEMRKILILGATGFIGRNLAEYFASRDDFIVTGTYFRSEPYHCPGVNMVRVDLTDRQILANNNLFEGMDVVIQAAAYTSGIKDGIERPYLFVTENAVMNAYLFRAAYNFKVRHLIFLSCATVYPQYLSEFESVTEVDLNYYNIDNRYLGGAWTKVYNEKMCKFYSKLGETRFTVIRHSNIIGPHDKFDSEYSHVFAATISKVMRAEDNGMVVVWGDGRTQRDFLYVSDLIDLIESIIRRQSHNFEIFNAGSGKLISVEELTNRVIELSGKKLEVFFDHSKPSINTKVRLNCIKAERWFNWKPKISLDEGVQRTIESITDS
jgi:nucleoside-diphosphate-sugar epimerase